MPARRELGAQLAVVVDLAVEDDAQRAVRGPHGLGSGLEIDDAEPAVAEPHGPLGIAPEPLRVGSPVRQGQRHAPEVRFVAVAREARDAAHHASVSRFSVVLIAYGRFCCDS